MLTAIFRGRRPALWAALACAAGILAGSEASFSCEHWTVAAATAFAAVLLARYTGWAETAPCVCCCLLLTACLGAARYRAATELLPADHVSRSELFGERLRLRGALASDPEVGRERTRFAVDLSAVELEEGRVRASGRVLIVSAVPVAADYADSVVLEVHLRRPSPARNPAAFDYRAFLQQRDIHAVASVRRRDQVLESAPRTGAWLQERVLRPSRTAIREAIEANLSGAPAGLLLGMLLGEKYRIPAELKEQFRSTGLAHALVVSGLHVGLIALFFLFGLRTCRLPDRAAALATTAVLALYALITDLQPPVVRAAIMAGVVLVGRALDRQGDVYNSLGLAALIILLGVAGQPALPQLPAFVRRDPGDRRAAREPRRPLPLPLALGGERRRQMARRPPVRLHRRPGRHEPPDRLPLPALRAGVAAGQSRRRAAADRGPRHGGSPRP